MRFPLRGVINPSGTPKGLRQHPLSRSYKRFRRERRLCPFAQTLAQDDVPPPSLKTKRNFKACTLPLLGSAVQSVIFGGFSRVFCAVRKIPEKSTKILRCLRRANFCHAKLAKTNFAKKMQKNSAKKKRAFCFQTARQETRSRKEAKKPQKFSRKNFREKLLA